MPARHGSDTIVKFELIHDVCRATRSQIYPGGLIETVDFFIIIWYHLFQVRDKCINLKLRCLYNQTKLSDKQYRGFFSLYVVVFFLTKDYSGSGKEASMDQKQIGLFLKELRKQKGLTQGQLAEKMGVSDRTVSRWENGNNMPDLSILVELADYYEIDIREIIDGKRKGENMNKELKDTLLKVADYSDTQKQKAERAGNNAFGITFLICTITIVAQLLVSNSIAMVAGETIIMMIGGMAYLLRLVRSGAFDNPAKNAKAIDTRISGICSGAFSIVIFLLIYMNEDNMDLTKIIFLTILLFVVIMIVGRIVLSLLGRTNDGNVEKDK